MNFFLLFNNTFKHNIAQKILFLFLSFIIYIFLVLLIAVFIIKPIDFYVVNELKFNSILQQINKTNGKIIKYSFILILFIVPVFEELIFRLCLVANKLNFSVFLAILIYKVSGGKIISFEIESCYFNIILGILSFILLFQSDIDAISHFFKNNTKIIIVFSILLFGLGHIVNIKNLHWELIFFYPIFVIPQLLLGYFITNLRLKYGFSWGLVLHSLVNGLFYVLNN